MINDRVLRRQESQSARKSSLASWGPLFLIWLFAVAVRVILLQGQRVVWGDEPFYLWLGRNWVTGQGYSFTGHPDVHHVPLFPWLAGLLYLLTHNLELASDILYVFFGSLLVVPVYAIGTELYDRRVGWGAAALTAAFPALAVSILYWGSLTEPIYMFFVYLGCWATVRVLRAFWRRAEQGISSAGLDPWWAYGLGGLSFGLAYLTRPEAISYFVIMGAFVLLLGMVRRRFRDLRFWAKLLVYGLAFGLAFLPYAYYTYRNIGTWMVSEKVGVTYLTGIGLAHGDTAAFDRSTWGLDSTGLETFFFSSESYEVSMVDLILADPRTFVYVLTLNLIRFVQVAIDDIVFPAPLVPLVALALFAEGWTKERALKELFLIAVMLPIGGFVLFFIQGRYLVSLVPVLILWTSCGVFKLSDWLTATLIALRSGPQGQDKALPPEAVLMGNTPSALLGRIAMPWRAALEYAPLILVILGLLILQSRVKTQVLNVGSVRSEHRTVGEHLTSLVPHDAVIMARYPAIAFHAQTKWVPTPNATWPEILRYARHKQVRYFALDERELRYRPQLQFLLTGEQIPAELRLIYRSDAGGERLVIYELLPEPSG